ncbi:uncharacterized protein LACBIDRAFT_308355 [Laccaria bicolor S238N-H82]|uniref:Predicted protein n=1 Tax=Laccaria bicolor (strain S238N-H82 / ATCC MYA-4686) TaxID=486041 RepID=B0DS56_LACBS|nr:uncharacterized protein LACBIDRAFT_308355 [Laccaria bicolor S238N-H82]EDR02641.1 predicted protein [Laccaria bicolor S238N-H82]|eukprot:XP_001886685.1 predicted protein [Laccaria bicolor S238N-H82]
MTRSLTIKVDHAVAMQVLFGQVPIAFDAHVLKWSLDDSAWHHVKEASFYGTDTYSLAFDMVIKVTDDGPELSVNFTGMQEKGVWPGKKSVEAEGRLAMRLLEELDSWLEVRTGEQWMRF